jgi:Dullard-like phosphatase family protein
MSEEKEDKKPALSSFSFYNPYLRGSITEGRKPMMRKSAVVTAANCLNENKSQKNSLFSNFRSRSKSKSNLKEMEENLSPTSSIKKKVETERKEGSESIKPRKEAAYEMFLPTSSMVFTSLKGVKKSFLGNSKQGSRYDSETRKPTRVVSTSTSVINANEVPAKEAMKITDGKTLGQKVSMKDFISRMSVNGSIVKGNTSLKESKSLSSLIPSFLHTEQLAEKKNDSTSKAEEPANSDATMRSKSKYFSMINQFFSRKGSVSRDAHSEDKKEPVDLNSMFEKQMKTKYSALFRSSNRSGSRDVSEVSMPSYYFKNLQYYIRYNSKSEFAKKTVAHFKESFEAIRYSLTLRKPSDEIIAKSKLKMMGFAGAHPHCNFLLLVKHTLVFDLDETLIHVSETHKQGDCYIPLITKDGGKITVEISLLQLTVFFRPFLLDCLRKLKLNFELILWTSSLREYANKIVQAFDPELKIFDLILYRENCYQTPQGLFIKDLRILNRNLGNCFMIDNSALSFSFQLENGVPILPFNGESSDTELLLLGEYLEYLSKQKQPLDFNYKYFRFKLFKATNDLETLKKKLLQA